MNDDAPIGTAAPVATSAPSQIGLLRSRRFLPLFGTLQLALYREVDQQLVFVGLENFKTLFGDSRWSDSFWPS